jgi:(2Fe-2S) ferredoxin
MSDQDDQLRTIAAKRGIGGYKRHVLLCTGPNCCAPEVGMAAWEELKSQIKEQGLGGGASSCYRSKVGCLRICCNGPTMVVYPDGTWYHGMTADRIARLVKQHLIDGLPVAEWVFARNPLGEPTRCDEGSARAGP